MSFRFSITVLSGIFVILLSGCAAQLQKAQVQHALGLGVDHFVRTIKVKDDSFEGSVAFSTEDGFQEKRGILGIVWNDQFLRGFIDKKTGLRTYQVYVVLRHHSGQWLHPYQANFGRPLISRKVDSIATDVDCTASDIMGCEYLEHVAFNLPAKEIQRVVEKETSEDLKARVWAFKLKTKAGKDYMGAILLAEINGLKKAMDAYKPIAMR